MKPMKFIVLIFLLPLLLVAGCAYHAKHYDAPDHAAVLAAAGHLRATLARAKGTAARAQAGVEEIAVAADEEGTVIAADQGKLADLLRVAPPELREAVLAIQGDNAALGQKHAELLKKVGETRQIQVEHAQEMASEIPAAEAALAKAEHTDFANTSEQTAKLNEDEQKMAGLSSENLSLKTHSFLFRVVAGLGALALGALLVIWLLSKIAARGAEVAAKLPL